MPGIHGAALTLVRTSTAVAELVIRVAVRLAGEQRVRCRDGEDGVVGEAAPGREEREVRVLDAITLIDGADHITSYGAEHA